LSDESPARRRIPRPREQGACSVAISRPRNGAPGAWNSSGGESARRSFQHVAGGNRPEDRRSQYHHDTGAFAGEPPETKIHGAENGRERRRGGCAEGGVMGGGKKSGRSSAAFKKGAVFGVFFSLLVRGWVRGGGLGVVEKGASFRQFSFRAV